MRLTTKFGKFILVEMSCIPNKGTLHHSHQSTHSYTHGYTHKCMYNSEAKVYTSTWQLPKITQSACVVTEKKKLKQRFNMT